MESFFGDTEESTEDIPGRKKSKLQSLKTRLFGRSKKTGGAGKAKLSQSASDITAEKALGSDEDLVCSQGMMGSRAMSHDSIFLADQVLTATGPVKVLSQENVHSKIKALQMKLQQQKMHMGPPPLVLPIRRPEDLGVHSEDDSLPHSPLETTGGDVTSQGVFSKTISQASSRPLSPIPKPSVIKPVPLTPSLSLPLSVPSNPSFSVVEPPLDFSFPAQFTPCLDMSAARHRMSVKPRNQRASTKKRLTATDSRSHSCTINNVDHSESVKEEEHQLGAQNEVTVETDQGDVNIPVISQCLPSKYQDHQITSEAAPKSFSPPSSQQDDGRLPSVASQVLRVKPHKPMDVTSNERPHSSFIESDLKDKRDEDFAMHDKRNILKKTGWTADSSDQLTRAVGTVHQQLQGETESTKGIKRPSPGSGSFHFSITAAKTRDRERPRSGSFVGALEQAEARQKAVGRTEDKPFSSMKEKEELKDLQPRGGPFAIGKLRQEAPPPKSTVISWDKRDSLKKTETVTTSKHTTTDTSAAAGEEVESTQEVVEEAVEAQEAQEEEGKTAFGIKLRSTSQSKRFRSDASPTHHSKLLACEEQCDKQKRQEISENLSFASKKLQTTPSSTSGDVQLTDPVPSASCLPIKDNLPSTGDRPFIHTEVQTSSLSPRELETSRVLKEPQAAPQTASSEVSWMSLAIEKTRSLQQLFTSRFPRDFTGAQTTAQPQTQVQPTNQTETGVQMQTQTVKLQPSTTPAQTANQPLADIMKTETVQSRSQAQVIKPSQMAMQHKTSTTSTNQINISREPQMPKPSNDHLNTTQSASQPASNPPVQINPWATQSPLHSSTQTETSSQLAQGSVSLAQAYLSSGHHETPQQPPWSNQGLHRTNQLKSAVSTTSSAMAPSPVSALGKGGRETNMQDKEISSLTGKQTVWARSVSERAAFLEKQAEGANPPGIKGVELRKPQTEVQTPRESPATARIMPLNKDTKPEGRQVIKVAESSPIKVPDRPHEDKWLRKNVASTSPSSSPTQPSVLQSMSDSGQPSWMELAKRKSMAWSDRTMD
ncbi:acrosomal protein KIAA1210 [Mastacembelus armatus]|uniref:Cracd like a n=1 Tax=Mastacembelus armatus TaxID=205130 RepID=A0A3Q3MC33_9TELE|nr:uncharacterized protein KIAA1211-like homolog [Mastacembelus armatus]XP_026152326.1 uncharacterized protein KIAA1211-like homolog [Mastacembelus armatus]